MKKMLPRISVVIPTYSSWETLKNCLESIYKQTLQPNEVIVVDNGLTEGTYQKISAYAKAMADKQNSKFKILKNKKNLGVTGGRNRGIKEADKNSDYIFFFDHDMVADKNMLQELVNVAQIKKEIGIVTPKIYYWWAKNVIWAAGTDVNLLTGQTIFYGGKDMGQYDEAREVAVAPAAILVKNEVVETIKRFDPIYFATYEDTDFCFRAKDRGFITYYAPHAIAYHNIPYDEKYATQRLLERTYWIGRNRVIFMKRYGKNFPLFLLFIPIFFSYYAYLSIKHAKTKPILEFTRGTIEGLFIS